MQTQDSRLQQVVAIIQQANQIAANTELDTLLDQMLDLLIKVTEGESGTIYLYDENHHELIFMVVKGDVTSQRLIGKRFNAERGIAGLTVREAQPVFVHDVANDPRWDAEVGEMDNLNLRTLYSLPLILRGKVMGLVQIFNLDPERCDDPEELVVLDLICARLVTELDKTRLLAESERRRRRQEALVEIVSQLTTTLDQEELLNRIMDYACDLLNVEATSIWLRDQAKGDLALHLATGKGREHMVAQRVPEGHGFIGHVVATGETLIANDVASDPRFYRKIDDASGFTTRALLCVPLRAPRIELGGTRGSIEGRIIGGAQALNPRDGRTFDAEDIKIFESLTSQAATVIRLAQLYRDVDTLSNRIIDAITGAIDLKDPYTRGHSQRVSEFSVAIAEELGITGEELYRIRIASKLHDVGKIRVPDRILKKRAALTEAEFRQMRRHPVYGLEFLEENGLLELDLLHGTGPALAQHHERLDGRGYPYGLKGGEIPIIARIVAVADVFDAITSNRPYRPARSCDEAIAILQRVAGSELDATCVDAFIRARARGAILTQEEREGSR
ncbi:MAG: GAF domain-containing protein [Candidatus Viridilinea halotolerans]|uniref:GAF domain-containing protein n=1 Tax=Candidatus Viridilinea halotolerans TaxID=2491704 RepID=A0A426TYE0_9CHLR|nr:MAG: GAF domain-containing protein [Candidatus Viridilinea halotolerans]